MRVAVVGCGYVGLVSAVGLASVGHRVTGIEGDPERRERIAAGIPPFHEPGLAELLATVQSRGAFDVTGDIARVRDAEVVLLAVQTPPDRDGALDTQPLAAAAETVGAVLAEDTRQRVVATRSTVLPGTVEELIQPLLDDGKGERITTAAAANPEFLREGSAVDDFLHPDRVVLGCTTEWGARLLEDLYAPLTASAIVTPPATAELAKYTSNSFLATLISFSNEIARVCEDLPGVDVEDVLGILHTDRRLRVRANAQETTPAISGYLRAGCGFGGSCLPKDLSALIVSRHRESADTPLLESVRAINRTQPTRFVDLAEKALGGLDGKRCAVLGLAFKAGTDDLRESPGLATVESLAQRGASVVAFDPLVGEDRLGAPLSGSVEVAATLSEAVAGAEACLVTTADPAFSALPDLIRTGSPSPPVVVDGRRALRPADFPDGTYVAIGRGSPPGGFPLARRPRADHNSMSQPNSVRASANSSGVPMSQ